MTPNLSMAEKIETIMDCRASGTLGKYVDLGDGLHRVEAVGNPGKPDMVVLVKRSQIGWSVSFCGIQFEDPSLLEAARMAHEWQAGHKGAPIITKNVEIGVDIKSLYC